MLLITLGKKTLNMEKKTLIFYKYNFWKKATVFRVDIVCKEELNLSKKYMTSSQGAVGRAKRH